MTLSLCLPYYRAPMMLAHQYGLWASYPEDLKPHIEIVLVDDGTPIDLRYRASTDVAAVDVPRPEGLPALRIYRVLVDIPWHQHGARNLAAKAAEGPWLLLTDMDHVVPAESLRDLLTVLASAGPKDVFTFNRLDAPRLTPTRDQHGRLKPHVNTLCMRRDWFWRVGGYDEDCVGYGTDGHFRNRLNPISNRRHLAGIPVIRYPREVIADASMSEPGVDPRVLRNRGRRPAETRANLSRKAPGAGPKTLAFPWEQVL